MKRSLILTLIFVVLAVGALISFYLKNDKNDGIPYKQHFAIEDPGQIHEVFIVHRDGRTVRLKRENKFWTVNDVYRARQSAIDLMLQTSKDMKVKYIPPEAMLKRIQENLASKGIKITYLDKSGEVIKTYYMGSGDNSGYGTFMIMEDTNDPFAVHVPDFAGGLRARFRLTEDEWRDRHIFTLNKAPTSVRLVYPLQPESSFEMTKEGRKYKYTQVSTGEKNDVEKKELAEVYMKSFEKLIAESIESQHPRFDSIIQSQPFCLIDFNFGMPDESSYQVFPDYNENYIKGLKGELEGSDSILRYFIYSPESGDLSLIQNRVFKEILRTKAYFFE